MKEVRLFLIFADFCIPCFEVTWMGPFFSSMNFISRINYGFMWMVHDIFHAILIEIKAGSVGAFI